MYALPHARVTHPFRCLPHEQAVHGRAYHPGDVVSGFPAEVALRNAWGEMVEGAVEARDTRVPETPELTPTTPAAPAPQPTPAQLTPTTSPVSAPEVEQRPRARVKRAVDVSGVDGKPMRLPRGTVVSGATAALLIEEGVAVELDDDDNPMPRPSEAKSLGAAPENK